MATDYFNKWMEDEAYASIKEKDLTKFVWKNIVCQFEISHAIVMDNELQLDSSVLQTFYLKLNIKKPLFDA